MANTVTQATLATTNREVIKQITISSDGSEETDLVIFDRSVYDAETTKGLVTKIDVYGSACDLTFEWDQTTDANIVSFAHTGNPAHFCFKHFGGIKNPGATGATGDVLLTTGNLDSGDLVTIFITVRLT